MFAKNQKEIDLETSFVDSELQNESSIYIFETHKLDLHSLVKNKNRK